MLGLDCENNTRTCDRSAGTRLKVCVWWGGGGGGSHTHYCITPVPILGAGALMLNAWDWTVTIP